MKLIVGLGNPGKEYEKTKHNVGFATIDKIATNLNVKLDKTKFGGIFHKGDGFILAKPMTYMNRSGVFVQALCNFFKISSNDILIIVDDMDHNVGQAIIKPKGSSGGQNGLKSIFEEMATQEILRLKIGIGRPHSKSSSSHVLSPFSKMQQPIIDNIIAHSAQAAINFLTQDIAKVITQFNEKYKKNTFSS